MKTLLIGTAAFSALLVAGAACADGLGEYPPNAAPGHCYQRISRPELTETYREQVVDVPAHLASRTLPAVFRDVDKQVIAREGRTEYFTAPATYRQVTETVVVRPETVRVEEIPAQYETVTDRVLVREAHAEWRRGRPAGGYEREAMDDPSGGEVLCLIEVPAEYRLVTRQVMRAPPRTIDIPVPAEVRRVIRDVVDQPAHEVRREVLPIYTTVRTRVVAQPERTESFTVPATYRDVVRTRIVAPAHTEWREYQCRDVVHPPEPPHWRHDHGPDGERGAIMPPPALGAPSRPLAFTEAGRGEHGVNADRSIARLQSALTRRGYYSGPIDGLFTIPTGDALTRFQREKDLPIGGFSDATAQALDLQ